MTCSGEECWIELGERLRRHHILSLRTSCGAPPIPTRIDRAANVQQIGREPKTDVFPPELLKCGGFVVICPP
jgi:hypothetical protein